MPSKHTEDEQLGRRLDTAVGRWRSSSRVVELAPLPGGASSLTYVAQVECDGLTDEIVVKVAPAGLAPTLNRDVLRQARILDLLAASAVPVPTILFTDEGEPPDVPPLFAMTKAPGRCLEPFFESRADVTAEETAAWPVQAARTLAHLHRIETSALELEGEVLDPVAEIDRWARVLHRVPLPMAAPVEECVALLRRRVPAAEPPAIVHGDFRLGNLVFDGLQVSAVIDWEIWGLGDPRTDLAWLLAHCDARVNGVDAPDRWGMPDPGSLVDVYQSARGRAVGDLDWFRALVELKASGIWSLLLRNGGGRVDPKYDGAIALLPARLERAIDSLRA